MGLPALLFSIAIANPCQAVQVSNYASPPPTPITRAPAPDQATAATSSQEPARYAPPVHVTPPADYTARPTQDINHQTESVNGRRNLTRLVGYSKQATVTKLSDETLSQAAAQLPAVEPPRDLVSQPIASGQYNGLHGYRNTPTRQVEPREQGKIRRPGLQDHIASAFSRIKAAKNDDSTKAVPGDVEILEVEGAGGPISQVAYAQSTQGGAVQASGAAKHRRPTAKRVRNSDQPEWIEHEGVLYVRHEGAVVDQSPSIETGGHRVAAVKWETGESQFEEEPLDPVEFATDYQRPLADVEDEWGSDRVDEEILPTARVAPLQQRAPVRPPRVAQAVKSFSRSQRSKSTRGKQVSVLTRSGQGSDTRQGSNTRQGSGTRADAEFSEPQNRLRDNQQIEKLDDFDPLNDPPIGLDDFEDEEDKQDDELDELDRDIDQELEQLRKQSDEDDLDDEDEDEDEDSVSGPDEKDCATFRNELLNSSIRDIPLDISPPASSLPGSSYPIGRSWTDRSGNVIATGAMQDLRRGYVILDSGQKIPYARLSESDLAAVSEFWRLPTVCTLGNRGHVERNWIPQTFTWTASNVCHKTLFFENVQLERYGHSHGPFLQPVQSVAHFFVSLATVSYQAAIHPANECNYALGYYRPGNCAPWLKDPIPISLDGARRQALVTTGLAFIP